MHAVPSIPVRRIAGALAVMMGCLVWSAGPAQARWLYPWGVGVHLSSGYTVATPYADLDPGAFVGGGVELRYTTMYGVGGFLECDVMSAFLKKSPNPFEHDTDLLVVPLSLGIIYEYPHRVWRPFITASIGYTFWDLDMHGVTNHGGQHRMNLGMKAGLAYRLWDRLFLQAALQTQWPNLFSGGEAPSMWLGGQVGVMWRF